MAVPLFTISYSNTFQPNKHPNIFPKQSQNNRNLTLSLLSNPFIRTTNLSPPQSPVAVSAVSGSPGIDASVVSEDTGSLFDSVQVFDLNGNSVPISDLWKDRKAVVAFARHFGCVLCRKRADYLAAKKEIMDAASVALVLIGPGSVDQICVAAIHSTCKTKGESQVGIGPMPAKYPPTLK